MVFGQLKHCLWKVSAVYSIEPSRTDDEVLVKDLLYGLFALKLAFAVNAYGSDFSVFAYRFCCASVEDIVRTYMHQRTVNIPACQGQIPDALAIDAVGQFTIFLTAVDIGVGGRIDYNVRFLITNIIDCLLFICNIQCF